MACRCPTSRMFPHRQIKCALGYKGKNSDKSVKDNVEKEDRNAEIPREFDTSMKTNDVKPATRESSTGVLATATGPAQAKGTQTDEEVSAEQIISATYVESSNEIEGGIEAEPMKPLPDEPLCVEVVQKDPENQSCTCFTSSMFPHRRKKCASKKILEAKGTTLAVVGAVVVAGAVAYSIGKEDGREERDEDIDKREDQLLKESADLAEREKAMVRAFELLAMQQEELEVKERALVRQEALVAHMRKCDEAALARKQQDLNSRDAAVGQREILLNQREQALAAELSKVRPTFDVVFVLDTSGSMAGRKSEEMFHALCEIIVGLDAEDGIGLMLFNNQPYKAIGLTKRKRLDFPNCIISTLIQRGGKFAFWCSGGTSLYDAMGAGITTLQHRGDKETVPHLVVVSDGMDCCSRHESAASMFHKLSSNYCCGLSGMAKFRCSYVTIGDARSAFVQDILRLQNMPGSVLLHYNAPSAGDIRNCFKAISSNNHTAKGTCSK